MKQFTAMILALGLLISTTSCSTFQHKVGMGATTGQKVEEGAWFALWGLVKITKPDSKKMAGGSVSYDVTTQFSFVDVIISAFTGWVTIYKQTVTVEK